MDIGTLFRENEGALYRYLVRLTGDVDAASDALQGTFLTAMEKPPKTESNVRAWLFATATNTARGTHRTESRQRELLERFPNSPPSTATALADKEFEQRELRLIVRKALASPREKERAALLLRSEGCRYHEIAEAIGTTTDTIGTLLVRATRKLAEELRPIKDDLL